MLNNLFGRHVGEALRRLRNGQYEATPEGVLLPAMNVTIGGFFETSKNGGAWEVEPNLVTTEGRNHILSVALAQGTQKLAFYIGLFSGDVTPASTWTGANWVGLGTEITTAYDEANRVVWDKGAVASGSVDNTASPAVFTFNAASTARGAVLVEASAKSAVTGVLIAAARFTADKVMADEEELRVKYTLALTSS